MATNRATLDATAVRDDQPVGASTTRNSRLRSVQWRWLDCGVGLLAFVLWRWAMSGDNAWLEEASVSTHLFFTAGLPALWMLLFPLFVARRRGAGDLLRLPGLKPIAKEAMIMVPIALGSLALLYLISNLRTSFGVEPLGTSDRTAIRSDVFGFVLLSITLTPIAEELFFRGFLYNAFRKHINIYLALLLQAVLFAVVHSYSPGRLLVVFLLGLIFGAVYEWRKTLIASVFLHFSINALSALATVSKLMALYSLPFLGVTGEATPHGYHVDHVTAASPASAGGILAGDRILRVDGAAIETAGALKDSLAGHDPGDTLMFEVQREEAVLRLPITLSTQSRD